MLSLDQEVGLSDALLLEPPTEEAFVSNLHQRFKRDLIYVRPCLFYVLTPMVINTLRNEEPSQSRALLLADNAIEASSPMLVLIRTITVYLRAVVCCYCAMHVKARRLAVVQH